MPRYESGTGKFLLSLGTKGDAGQVQCHFRWGSDGKTPEGLPFSPFTQAQTLTGKAGTLDVVSTGRTYDMGFGESYVWEGMWRITKATDEYAGLAGSASGTAASIVPDTASRPATPLWSPERETIPGKIRVRPSPAF